MAHSGDNYGSMGSVPNPTSVEGSGAGPMQIHANPNQFGAGSGVALQKAGEAGNALADKFGGMIMETAANQAELGYIKESGDIKAKYSQYQGLQAEAMRPQYEADLNAVHQKYGSALPPMAKRQYESNTFHSLGGQSAWYADYAADQVKSANINSQKAISDVAVNSAANLDSVLDDSQVGQALGTIAHSGNAIADATGLGFQASGQDADTGNYAYPDTPEGRAAKAQHLQYTDAEKSKYFLTGAKTIADNQGASAAVDWAKKHWDLMPDAAKVQMNQFIAPKMKNETIGGNVVRMNGDIDRDFTKQMLANIPSGPTDLVKAQQNPLDVIRKNEGLGYSKDSKGEVVNGINSLAFPKEFGEAKHILDTQGQAAATKYTDDFYQKNILDKYDIKSLPADVQTIVADGLVNHGTGTFGKSLIDAAKNGASPQELVDMRRSEYERLATADPAQYGPSLKGWNARLDKLELSGREAVSGNRADYLRANEEKYVGKAVDDYLQHYPDDYYGAQLQEHRARTEIRHHITDEDGKLKADRDMISNAVGGGLTKGVPPATYEQLRTLPGMAPLLDKVMQQQGEWFHGIDTMIAKSSHRDATINSANGYDTILRTLEPNDKDHPNRIGSVDHLSKLLGDNKGTGITWKDFQDAKGAIELDDTLKTTLRKSMQEITNANGNLDGKGQDRALAWYSQVMNAKKQNDSLGDKALSPSQFAASISEKTGPLIPAPPSRMQQIENWATSLFKSTPKEMPMFSSPGDPEFAKLPSGTKFRTADGKIRTKK